MCTFARDRSGGAALIFSIALPTLLIGVSACIDISNLNAQQSRLRSVADSAALAAAREVRLGTSNVASIQRIAEAYVYSIVPPERLLGPPVVTTSMAPDRSTVQVSVSQTVGSMLGVNLLPLPDRVTSSSTARIMAGAPICMVALDNDRSDPALASTEQARLTASGCSIYSNARGPEGMLAGPGAWHDVAMACSGGGVKGAARFSALPRLDCPQLPDPLAARPEYATAGCTQTKLVVSGAALTRLSPGVYCGGLTIRDEASVELNPGVYFIKGGPFLVKDRARVSGVNVGIFLAGAETEIRFIDASVIDLSGPTGGWMAGMLFQEKRRGRSEDLKTHLISTPNARKLLGTIYLPAGRLKIETSSSVAGASAFTIIVAARIAMSGRSNLVLNTGYASVDVPVPDGVGPASGGILLER